MLDDTSEGMIKTGGIHVCDRYHFSSNCKKIGNNMPVTGMMELYKHVL